MALLGLFFLVYWLLFGFLLLACALMGLRLVLGHVLAWLIINIRSITGRWQQQRANVIGGFLIEDTYPVYPKR